jgi:hypothetical protein
LFWDPSHLKEFHLQEVGVLLLKDLLLPQQEALMGWEDEVNAA